MNIAFVNGKYCSQSEAKVSIFDRGFLFGDSVYEVLPVYHGQPYFVDQHLDRLFSNMKKIKMTIPNYDWHGLIHRLISENNGGNLQVYIQVTRGNQGVRKHDIPTSITPSVIAFTMHNSFPTLEDKEQGMSAKLVEDFRWMRCDIKTTSLIANILLNDEAVSSGFHTAILARNGLITEGSSTNVFIVTQDGVIKTPPMNNFCLPGITRQVVIEIIKKLDLKFREIEISMSELFSAQEVWITSTTKEVFPITKINDSLINGGKVGEYWRIINDSYQQLVN
ncbi:TPA: D-amino acid aminotransferase [Legionella pneumophila subsp. pneumophila]|uniref:D-amino acid aminotransferase n=1 Tax=Legionella pneumophila TaxID=446 RepID=UPI0007708888|nr:D-amino acid aminotransferase [Legionella pneumophila]HAT9216283.1 D-amino acid aminotransferase [Legionella pneumophila subsp. pneumophila]CZG05976.1 D-alanine aminotransferase [Legionella pneumophila]HAT9262234.1 D-amino acid aminotransferase [Legionella pneumophila subsp. pneumophila]HAT9283782.1 D-amino acid aminotransferase [Legionella pneumophila subsp. pneumophila]HAT9289825.1 D-amino acid aminotransferase [Legionella pneumophila subsp. pneumophila]